MILPILYSFRRCPYAMRARLAIIAGGKHVELREVALRDKPASMLGASPKGTVPVLVLPDGDVIDQSLDIMRWATMRADGTVPPSDPAIIVLNDGPFKHHLDRCKYVDRYPSDGIDHREAATEILGRLDARLSDSGRLCSDPEAFTDLAVMPFVRQFAATDRSYFDDLQFAYLHAWLAGHLRSDLFVRAMVRVRPWSPGDAPTVFPPDASAPIGAPQIGRTIRV
ncbi:glutathione S-transferase [Sphingomonas sp. R86520]|uniref:glutathione S-transferase n=1 Tax=Sphingomonas sp. R86520 TaxID=3093859 RepID=UPI0036D253A1